MTTLVCMRWSYVLQMRCPASRRALLPHEGVRIGDAAACDDAQKSFTLWLRVGSCGMGSICMDRGCDAVREMRT